MSAAPPTPCLIRLCPGDDLEAAAIILAGGQSRRMGRSKALLDWHGLPLIQHIAAQLTPHFECVLISAREAGAFAFLNLPIVPDSSPGEGPLMGIASALAASPRDWNFITACDRPDMPLDLIRALFDGRERVDCVVPRYPDGAREPLFGFYHRRVLPRAEALLESGERSVQALLSGSAVHEFAVEASALRGANTPEAWERLLREHKANTQASGKSHRPGCE